MNLNDLNNQTIEQARHTFLQCCTSITWVNTMVQARPFTDKRSITNQADLAWQELSEVDYLEAFEGHPKIGDVNSLRAKYANTKELAGNEQGLVKEANDDVLFAQQVKVPKKCLTYCKIACQTLKRKS